MAPAVFTIGYTDLPRPDFPALLKRRGVSLPADGRSRPHPRYFPNYDKEALSHTLKGEGLCYCLSPRSTDGGQKKVLSFVLFFPLFSLPPL